MAKKKTSTLKKVGEAAKDAAQTVKKKVVKPAADALGVGGAKKSTKSGAAKKSTTSSKTAKSGAAKKSTTAKTAKSGAAKKKTSK